MTKKNQAYILIDMTWWKSSSRRRGIGVYLKAFFTKYFQWGDNKALWFVPEGLSASETKEFKEAFQSKLIIPTISNRATSLRTSSGLTISPSQISFAISGSPFERPKSLLSDLNILRDLHIPLKIVIHDLLPLEFKQRILQKWSDADQNIYRDQLTLMNEVTEIYVTGKSAGVQVLKHFPSLASRLSMIPFGESENWFEIPVGVMEESALIKQPYALTISGGEWRKNLVGTLQFFSIKFPKHWKLVVICKLGKLELIKFQLLAIQYGLLDRVVWTGEVSEAIKWHYISRAKVLLSLSFGEGLNLPVLEAKSVGVGSILISDLRTIYDQPLSQPIISTAIRSGI